MDGIVINKLPDLSWGEPSVARAVGNDRDSWGVLAVLRETPWEPLFPLIPSSIFDQALRGHATPLMRLIGPPGVALAKRLPLAYTQCRMREGCINTGPNCHPGSKMPDCWEGSNLAPEAIEVATWVAILWRDGIPVIILVPEA